MLLSDSSLSCFTSIYYTRLCLSGEHTWSIAIGLLFFGKIRGICRQEPCTSGLPTSPRDPVTSSSSSTPLRQDNPLRHVSVRSIMAFVTSVLWQNQQRILELTDPEEQAQRRELFKNLDIAKEKVFKRHFGKYLVIYLDILVCESTVVVSSSTLMSSGRCKDSDQWYPRDAEAKIQEMCH